MNSMTRGEGRREGGFVQGKGGRPDQPSPSRWHGLSLARACVTQPSPSHLPAPLLPGEKVKVGLLGGSLALRGWNHADEAYVAQVEAGRRG